MEAMIVLLNKNVQRHAHTLLAPPMPNKHVLVFVL